MIANMALERDILPLMSVANYCLKLSNKLCGPLFIDLSKAFDTIDHHLLLDKLKKYGIRGICHNLIKCYLSNRTMYVKVNNQISKKNNVTIGTPQGSILGPLFFRIFINDLILYLDKVKVILYADDTTLFYARNNATDIQNILRNSLLVLLECFRVNKLSINLSKTKYMIFNPKRKTVIIENIVLPCGTEIEHVKSFKFFGIILDAYFTGIPS